MHHAQRTMRAIRERYLVFMFVIVFSTGCGSNATLENFDTGAWKTDKLGCNGERVGMISLLEDSLKQLKGLRKNDILSLFGKPEATELHPKGQLMYRYFVTPSKFCGNYDGQTEQLLEIRINALGIVSEANLYLKINY